MNEQGQYPQPAQQGQPWPPPAQPPKKPKRTLLIVLIVVGALVLCGAVSSLLSPSTDASNGSDPDASNEAPAATPDPEPDLEPEPETGPEPEPEPEPEVVAETEEEYKAKCEEIAYTDIMRSPASFDGKYVVFTGRIVQTVNTDHLFGDTEYGFRAYTAKDDYLDDYYEDAVYMSYVYGDGEPLFLEDDIVTAYGVCKGTVEYETVLGDKASVPNIEAKYIVLQGQ
ncbi:MAG: hypothetical protein LBL86_10700 [Coriobacteriales bacterium]|jgi:hypothetical protein|nr:hypothetical protein [Coriobacteriales bacterium]